MLYPSANILQFIRDRESFRAQPYWDVKGYSVGYGHQIKPGEEYLMQGVTLEKAEQLLSEDTAAIAVAVNKDVTAPINQNQFDALVSFTYNEGVGSLASSTLLKKIDGGLYNDVDTISTEFRKWVYAGGVVNDTLVQRREDELQYYFEGEKKKTIQAS